MTEILLIGAGAGVGATLRYLTTQTVNNKWKNDFPLATFLINILGSFLLGLLFGTGISDNLYKILGVGVMGGFTTFSTFNFELFNLADNKKLNNFEKYFVMSYAIGFIAAFLGIIVGQLIL
jgi:CrcB protein